MKAQTSTPERRNRLSCLAVALLLTLALSATSVFADPQTISEDTTYTGEVEFAGEYSVPAGVTVTFEPGTKVTMAADASIKVLGTLIARGTPEAPIIFSAKDNKRWEGITFFDAPRGSSMTHTTVRDAKAITVNGAAMDFSNIKLTNGEIGFSFATGSKSKVVDSSISGMDKAGITVSIGAAVQIISNKISNCAKVGISSTQKGLIRAIGNRIDNCEIGIAISDSGSIVELNTIEKCKSGILVIQAGPKLGVNSNLLTDNGTGILVQQYAAPRIMGNVITGSNDAIHVYQSSSPTIGHNILKNNKRAIACIRLCKPEIMKNVITDNGVGIHLHLSSYAVIHDNNFDRNDLHVELDNMSADWEKRASFKPKRVALPANAPRNLSALDPTEGFVDAFKNWWGEKTDAEMTAKGNDADIDAIKDYHDVPIRTYEGWEGEYVQDKVRYDERLTAPAADAGPGERGYGADTWETTLRKKAQE